MVKSLTIQPQPWLSGIVLLAIRNASAALTGQILQFPSGALNADPERQAALGEIRILLEGAIDALPRHFAKFSYCGWLRV